MINPITQLAVDLAELPADLRSYLLSLEAPRPPRGRPRALSFQEQIKVAQAAGEAINGHAVAVRDRKRDRAIGKLQAKFRRLCAAQAPPHKLFEVRAAIDRVGRLGRVVIKPPEVELSEIDLQVGKLFGISARTVRRIRTNPRMRPFMPHPVWIERDWLKVERLALEARQWAKQLMTPERYAKQEPVRIFDGGLQVGIRVSKEPPPNNPLYRPGLQLGSHTGQPDWFATQMWSVEMRGASERSAAMRTRSGEMGTISAPHPPVTSTPTTVPPYAYFGQRSPD